MYHFWPLAKSVHCPSLKSVQLSPLSSIWSSIYFVLIVWLYTHRLQPEHNLHAEMKWKINGEKTINITIFDEKLIFVKLYTKIRGINVFVSLSVGLDGVSLLSCCRVQEGGSVKQKLYYPYEIRQFKSHYDLLSAHILFAVFISHWSGWL